MNCDVCAVAGGESDAVRIHGVCVVRLCVEHGGVNPFCLRLVVVFAGTGAWRGAATLGEVRVRRSRPLQGRGPLFMLPWVDHRGAGD
jgi:hypothetical protein